HRGAVTACVFSPDGTIVLSASTDATLKIWRRDTGKEIRTLTGHRHRVNACAFSPDGTQILSASDDWSARLWNTKTGQQQRMVISRWRMWLHSFPRLGELLAREVWGGARLGVALWLALLLMVPVAVLFTAVFDWKGLQFKGIGVDLFVHIIL